MTDDSKKNPPKEKDETKAILLKTVTEPDKFLPDKKKEDPCKKPDPKPSFLEGKKTYITAIAMVIVLIFGKSSGILTDDQWKATAVLFGAAIAAFLRLGFAKATADTKDHITKEHEDTKEHVTNITGFVQEEVEGLEDALAKKKKS